MPYYICVYDIEVKGKQVRGTIASTKEPLRFKDDENAKRYFIGYLRRKLGITYNSMQALTMQVGALFEVIDVKNLQTKK